VCAAEGADSGACCLEPLTTAKGKHPTAGDDVQSLSEVTMSFRSKMVLTSVAALVLNATAWAANEKIYLYGETPISFPCGGASCVTCYPPAPIVCAIIDRGGGIPGGGATLTKLHSMLTACRRVRSTASTSVLAPAATQRRMLH